MAGGDGAEESVGQEGRIWAVPLNDELWRSGSAAGHAAGLACVGVGFGGGDAVGLEGLGYLSLQTIEGLDGSAVREVLDGNEKALILTLAWNDREADGVEVGVEDVGSMSGCAHPGLMDDGGVGAAADVFSNGGEVCPGLGAASGHVGLAWVLML